MNKDYRMAKFININGEYVAYTNESDLIELQSKEIERLNNIINELSEKNRNLLEDNMRLRKEINLHSGKLVINELEVKEVWK